MENGQPSLTAMMSAYIRAHHSMYDAPRIFDDTLAHRLIPDERRWLIEQGLAQYLQQRDPERAASCPDQATAAGWAIRAMTGAQVLSRARYTEDSLREAVGRGLQQYVILGAGLDTYAFRRGAECGDLQIFEIDHPATQAFKRQRINELGWEIPAGLHFVSTDFAQKRLALALEGSPYEPRAKTFFSWLGVSMYLTREEVYSTLHSIAGVAPANSIVVFDYLDADAFVPELVSPRVQEMMLMAQYAGEPMKTGFHPSTLAVDLARLGFRVCEDLSPAQIQDRYFQECGEGYHACEHVRFMCAAVE